MKTLPFSTECFHLSKDHRALKPASGEKERLEGVFQFFIHIIFFIVCYPLYTEESYNPII